jgi:hypothetical protein
VGLEALVKVLPGFYQMNLCQTGMKSFEYSATAFLSIHIPTHGHIKGFLTKWKCLQTSNDS